MLEQIQQVLAGDQEQFQALRGRYQPVIYRCMKEYYLKDYNTEDWPQEGRIALFRTLERFDSGKQASLGKLSKRNLENHVHSLIRHQCAYKRRTDISPVSLEQRSESAGEELMDYLGTAATNSLGQLMIREKLAAFPTRLSLLEQQILNAYLRGYTLEEIAKVRGGTFLTIRSACGCAKAKTKYTLESEQKLDETAGLSSKNSCKQTSSMMNLKFFRESDIMFLEVNAMLTTLSSIKKDLKGHIGSEIVLAAQIGREYQAECKGILAKTYLSAFVVDLGPNESSSERVSYSYSDVLARTVEIKFIGRAV